MSLKHKITAEDFGKLSAPLQAEYKKDGDGYVLDVDIDDPAELRRARDREKADAQAARDKLKKAEDDLAALRQKEADDKKKGLRTSNDFDALEAHYKKEVDDAKKALDAKLDKKNAFIKQKLVDDTAQKLAEDLAGDNAAILLPHIRSRLTADVDADVPTTKILDAAGNASLQTLEQLQAEFVANKSFSTIILASNGSGGGAPGGRQTGGGARKSFAEMTEAERTAFYKADPAAFSRASAEHKASRGATNI